jgi:hypothetical protein
MINWIKNLLSLIVTRFFNYKILFGKNDLVKFDPRIFINLIKIESEKYRFSTLESIKDKKINTILDFGANYGFDTYVFKAYFPDSKITLYDIDKNIMFYLSKINNIFFDNSLELLNKKAFNLISSKNNCYDLIYSNAVLLYVNKKEVKILLKKFIRMSRKYIVLHELNSEKNFSIMETAYYIHNFVKIIHSINPKIKINRQKTKKPGYPWNKYGSVIILSNFK